MAAGGHWVAWDDSLETPETIGNVSWRAWAGKGGLGWSGLAGLGWAGLGCALLGWILADIEMVEPKNEKCFLYNKICIYMNCVILAVFSAHTKFIDSSTKNAKTMTLVLKTCPNLIVLKPIGFNNC